MVISDSCNYDASLLTILLLNPDIKTLWNKRRLLILDKKAQLDFELNFVRLVLSFKPKSQDALNYRKWLLREFKGMRTIFKNNFFENFII